MNLNDFGIIDNKAEHKSKQSKCENYYQKLISDGKTSEQARAQAEMMFLTPNDYSVKDYATKHEKDYVEVKTFLATEDFMKLKKYVKINEHNGYNISANFFISVTKLLEVGDIIIGKNNEARRE